MQSQQPHHGGGTHGLLICAASIAASNITARTIPVVRPRNCPSSSFTCPDTSEGEGWAVVVTVTVGCGVGVAVSVGSLVGSLDGSLVGEGEVCAGLTPVAALTLKITDDVPDECPEKAEGEKGVVHIYRPQFRTTAITRMTAAGMSETATPTATPGAGALRESEVCIMPPLQQRRGFRSAQRPWSMLHSASR